MTEHGTYTTIDGRPAVRFERRLPHPAEAVWATVSEPDELAHWFPTRVELEGELRPGTKLHFAFPGEDEAAMHGEVLAVERPRLFAFLWGDDELRIELEPDGDGCRVSLTHLLSDAEEAARTAAGWHVCVDRLARRVAGEDTEAPGPEPTPEWRAHYDAYVERGLPSGAPVPD
jgi:uncharacterized protein YndB with AHSA1/START domain